jgi:osmotically-inducible protein OsmY
MRRYRPPAPLTALILPAVLAGCAVSALCGYRECPEDAAITAEVWALLDHYPELRPPNQLHVQTHEHLVMLSGMVNSEYERRLAESVAHEAKGVTRVVSYVGVNNAAR